VRISENTLKLLFSVFRPMKPGVTAFARLHLVIAPICNRASFPCKTFHKMKKPIACRGPRALRVAAVFALLGELHKKITQSPSAGGG